VWIPLLLVVATAAVYQDVRRHDFVDLDDFPYVLENRDLRVSSLAEALRVAFRSTSQVNWTPLTVLSLQADRALYGDEAPGYLLGNVALHAASAALLFLALLRLTGNAGPSAFVAAVFALHPLHVESVAWAAQRKDVLSGLFWMLTLLAYAVYVAWPAARRYLWVLLALCAALLAKPVAVTLPCVLLLLDYWPLGRLTEPVARRRALLEKLPLLLPVVAVAALTLALQQRVEAVTDTQLLPITTRLAAATDAYALYLLKSFWPSGLAVFYPYPGAGIPLPRLLAELLLLGGASAAALLLARRRPYLLVGWLWYLGVLVPTIGLVQVGSQGRADRYTYLPMIGLAIAVAWGARDLAGADPRRRLLLAGTGGFACLALGATAALQVGHWRDAIALHRHAVSVTRDNVPELLRLSRSLRLAGCSEEAIPPLERALELAPRKGRERTILADLYARMGRLEEAEASYRRGLRLEPDNALGHANLGLTLVRLDRPREAKWHLKRALQLHADRVGSLPELATPYLALAEAHIELDELDRARPYYEYAASLEPRRSARVGALLAVALAEAGRFEEARALLDTAAVAAPGVPELRNAAQRIDTLSHAPLR
jgi:tetratricopeptide (TPR) repeat protein